MRVYLVRGASRIPLGSVTTLERRTFTVPSSMIGGSGVVQLFADPLGSRQGLTSEEIPATAGDRVTWSLEPSLRLSRYAVQRGVKN